MISQVSTNELTTGLIIHSGMKRPRIVKHNLTSKTKI